MFLEKSYQCCTDRLAKRATDLWAGMNPPAPHFFWKNLEKRVFQRQRVYYFGSVNNRLGKEWALWQYRGRSENSEKNKGQI